MQYDISKQCQLLDMTDKVQLKTSFSLMQYELKGWDEM